MENARATVTAARAAPPAGVIEAIWNRYGKQLTNKMQFAFYLCQLTGLSLLY